MLDQRIAIVWELPRFSIFKQAPEAVEVIVVFGIAKPLVRPWSLAAVRRSIYFGDIHLS